MKQYRIKTEQEFIDEFGSEWRKKVTCIWISPDMDYLFGKSINRNNHQHVDNWIITPKMITSKPNPDSSKLNAAIKAEAPKGEVIDVDTLSVPKFGEWISVEDRLPESKTEILVGFFNEFGKWRTLKAIRLEKHQMEADYFNGDTDVDENGNEYWPEGWYEWNEHEETHWKIPIVTHWMPLPTPPTNPTEE